jgi:hypothetical protein
MVKFHGEDATPQTQRAGALCFNPSDNGETKETIKKDSKLCTLMVWLNWLLYPTQNWWRHVGVRHESPLYI